MRYAKKGLESAWKARSGEFLHDRIVWHGASFTRVGGGLGIPKILGTGATLHLGPTRLHVENWECCALKSSARCQKFGLPCRFFSACKCGFRF